jgi:5-methylcytosine-specific restriction enzyme A
MTRRPVKEWIGKTVTSRVPPTVKERIIHRQDGKCAISEREFRPGDKLEFDHIKPLRDGGEHRESNLQAVLSASHKVKTAVEAGIRAKVKRTKRKHLGLKERGNGWNREFKKKLDGRVVRRSEDG